MLLPAVPTAIAVVIVGARASGVTATAALAIAHRTEAPLVLGSRDGPVQQRHSAGPAAAMFSTVRHNAPHRPRLRATVHSASGLCSVGVRHVNHRARAALRRVLRRVGKQSGLRGVHRAGIHRMAIC